MCKIVIIYGTKALVLKRSRWVIYHPGRWDVPGGAAEHGEDIEDAAVREAFEEIGFKVDSSKLILLDQQSKLRDGKPALRHCFKYEVSEEFIPKLSFEHSTYSWMEPDELDAIDLPNFYKNCIRISLGVKQR